MSLEAIFKAASIDIHNAFGDVNKTVIFSKRTLNSSTTYNPATGAFSEPAIQTQSIRMIFTSYKTEDIDNNEIHKNDRKGLTPTSELNYIPEEGDYITYGTEIFDIYKIKKDPASAEYIFQLRPRRN